MSVFKFRDLLKEDPIYLDSTITEQMEFETHMFLCEFVNLESIYDVKKEGNSWYEFVDKFEITHFNRLFKNDKDQFEIKFGFYDKETNRPVYTKPKIYSNLEWDEKIFNTQLNIIIKILVPYLFEQNTVDEKEVYFNFIDKPRCRLFKINLNKFLDKTKYKLNCDSEKDNILKIVKI